MDTKICRICNTEKPLSLFGKRSVMQDGIDTRCIQCGKEYAEALKIKNVDKLLSQQSMYCDDDICVCKDCGDGKPLREFYKNKNKPTGYNHKCKKCSTRDNNRSIKKMRIVFIGGYSSPLDMRECIRCGKDKMLFQFGVDLSLKTGYSGLCKACISTGSMGWAKNNRDRVSANQKKGRQLDGGKRRAFERRRYHKNIESMRAYSRRWSKGHLASRAKTCNDRRAKRINREVTYADHDAIKRKYRTAHILTAITGVQYHVDHIIPLNGELVSGLHHEDNLQVIKGKDNLSKGNKFIPQFIKINCAFIKYRPGEKIYQIPA